MMKKIGIFLIVILGSINAFSQDYFTFSNSKDSIKFGVVTSDGKEIISSKYKYIHYVQDHFIASKEYIGSCSVFNTTGKLLFSDVEDAFYLGNNRHVLLKKYNKDKTGKWAFYSLSGKKITDFIYDNVFLDYVLNDHAQMIKDSVYYLVDTTGSVVFQNKDYEIFTDSISLFCKKYFPNLMFSAPIINDGSENPYTIFKDGNTSKFGLKYEETSVLAPEYDEIYEMCCENFVVKKGNKYGVANNEGNLFIDLIYDNIVDMSYATIIVKLNGKYGVINRQTNKISVPIKYHKLEYTR